MSKKHSISIKKRKQKNQLKNVKKCFSGVISIEGVETKK